ncbi:MAG: hypothetical protein ACJ8F7_07250 [Gemmataceae bacterium]
MRVCFATLLAALVLSGAALAEEYKEAKVRVKSKNKVTLEVKDGDTGKDVVVYIPTTVSSEDLAGRTFKGHEATMKLLTEGNTVTVKTEKGDGKPFGEKGEVELATEVKLVKTLSTEDVAVAGAEFVGTFKQVRVNQNTGKTSLYTTDCKIIIKSRDSDKFTGEFWKNRDRDRMEIEGTIDNKGKIKFTLTKELRGTWDNKIIGQYKFDGTIKGKTMYVPGYYPGYKESRIDAKLKD